MRTITIYNYSELPPEAQAKALKNVRDRLEEEDADEAFRWAIDDCALFEPTHDEMVALFGPDYYEQNNNEFMFKNTRKNISLYDDYVSLSEALVVTNTTYFLTWLGIPEKLQHHVHWEIEEQYSELSLWHEISPLNPVGDVLDGIFEKAHDKFGHHCSDIKDRIEAGIEEYYSDENVLDKIENGSWEFDEDGNIWED